MTPKFLSWALIPVVLIVGGAVAFAVVSTDDELAPGFVTSGTAGTRAAHQVEVELPIGTVSLSAGRPLDEIPARRVGKGDGGTVAAEDGSVIVPLSWHFSPSISYQDSLAYPMKFSLALASGSERYALGTADVDLHDAADTSVLPQADVIAVVAGDGTDLAVDVGYEGETQTAELQSGKVDAGRAAPLYSSPGSREYATDVDCDPYRTRPARYLDPGAGSLSCTVRRVVQTPYLPDLGWAADGSVWSSVDVSVIAPALIGWLPTGGEYRVRRGPIRVTMDGQPPAVVPPIVPGRAVRSGTWVFASRPGASKITVHVNAPMTARRLASTAEGPRTVRFGVDQDFTFRP